MMNEAKGNMYSFVTHTWNTVKGKCPHKCHYCYMTKWGEQKPVRFDATELKTDLEAGNIIFVGSSCDMFAKDIPDQWILDTLAHCGKFDNTYLFQSKNPARFHNMMEHMPPKVIFGTTIESDINHNEMGETPNVINRALAMMHLSNSGYKTMVTIEPIMSFNTEKLFASVKLCGPAWVNIGANTNPKAKLPEPSPEKIDELITKLKEITEVKIKPNLKRLWNQYPK